MFLIDRVHDRYVFGRRVRKLAEHLAAVLPTNARVLDVGCGDGSLDRLILERRPDLQIHGIDVLVRSNTHIPVARFDGQVIPHDDASFDAVMFVDVLHHTDDPAALLREAARVASGAIVLKDHTADGLLAHSTLAFMDDVGNTRHGVRLPWNYWPRQRWLNTFCELGLAVSDWKKNLGLYPWPANCLFGRSLHFVARLEPVRSLSYA